GRPPGAVDRARFLGDARTDGVGDLGGAGALLSLLLRPDRNPGHKDPDPGISRRLLSRRPPANQPDRVPHLPLQVHLAKSGHPADAFWSDPAAARRTLHEPVAGGLSAAPRSGADEELLGEFPRL